MRVKFAGKWLGLWIAVLLSLSVGSPAGAQTVPTTTVQGTVYLANGQPGSGTVLVSWPAFTTAANQQVAAGSTTVTVGADGFLSVNLAANLGSNPAGLYYTAVFHLSDGTVSTQFWVVPAAASATLASVQAQLMPAAQAVQTVSKSYVDQAIQELEDSLLTANGGTLTGPLTLCCDPTAPLQAADKHSIDTAVWGFSGNGFYFSITAPGLTMNGGSGIDGQSAIYWDEQVEAGGTLLLEAVGVQLAPGSVGILAGLYSSLLLLAANCVAGFAVTSASGTGTVSVTPFVGGAAAGTSFTINAANQYTLRTRVHCPEVERITQQYRVVGDAGLVSFGGGGVVAQGRVEMELVEFVDGVAGTPVVLYDGAVGYLPGAFTVVAASSVNLIGTMRALYMKGLGTEWVQTVAPGATIGSAAATPVGALADGGACSMTRTGALNFYTGYAPALGAVAAAQYRSTGRAVGRAVNTASGTALAAAGSPPIAVWIGTVTEPKGRSSLDCRNAALALVTASSSVSAAWSGSYRTTSIALNAGSGSSSPVDVWPGDALLLQSGTLGLDVQVVVREAVLKYPASSPDVVEYAIRFSNDWANDLSIRTSTSVPADVSLPAAISPTYLANLTGLTVTAISPVAVTVTTGVGAPSGGGFEVRRRDFAFGPGNDPDLVMRVVVSTFDIPRATEADRFYIRMYDGATPPNYSEFSVALFLNLPLSVSL